MTVRTPGVVFVAWTVLFTLLHHALWIQATVWALSAVMAGDEKSCGFLCGLAGILGWPAETFLTSPAARMQHGWMSGWANSVGWGLGVTMLARIAARSLGTRGHRGRQERSTRYGA